MQKQYDKATYHSNNMYQLLSYIKNKEVEVGGKVGGILLYAKTQEDVVPNQDCKADVSVLLYQSEKKL